MNKIFFPNHTQDLVALGMREAVERTSRFILENSAEFEVTEKTVDYKDEPDIVTDVDIKAQEKMVDQLMRYFPSFGIIAEEDLAQKGALIDDRYELCFTIDPIDGTKSFERHQTHGIATMLSLLLIDHVEKNVNVVGTCIGDVKSREVFLYKPYDDHVSRLYAPHKEYIGEPLLPREGKKTMLVVREKSDDHSSTIDSFLSQKHVKYEIQGGSIGILFSKLWTHQYRGIILKKQKTTSWDIAPCVAISKLLGYVTLEICEDGILKPFDMQIPYGDDLRQSFPVPEHMFIHKNHLPWLMEQGILKLDDSATL